MIWINAKEQKPKQGVRVLLKITDEECPVVGYWACGEWEACTVNIEASDPFSYVEGRFESCDVTHYSEIT